MSDTWSLSPARGRTTASIPQVAPGSALERDPGPTLSRVSIPARLLAIARARGGVFSASDAARVDVNRHGLARLCREGLIVHIRRGAYVLAELWKAAMPDRRLALTTRAILATRPGSTATHASALAVHGLPLHGVSWDVVDIEGPVCRSRIRSGLRVHPRIADAVVVDVAGAPCLSIPLAVAQVLVRDGRDAALVPLDAALHGGYLIEDVIAGVDQLLPTPRARARAMRWLAMSDHACESVGETRSRLLLLDLGFRVRSQVSIDDTHGRFVGRVDLLVDDNVVVEFDGKVKYAGADGKEALAREKIREDRLRALGFAVVRLTWADLDRPEVVAEKIRRAKRLAATLCA